jgi:carboxylesterase
MFVLASDDRHELAAPFSLPSSSEGGDRGVVVVHGFTGTPFEMRLLGEDLAARGFAVEGPLLAGHGGTTRDLARTTWRDWVRSASDAVDRLRARVGNRKVAVVGLSMGALVTLELARTRPDDVAAIGCLAPALWLRPEGQAFAQFSGRTPLLRMLALPKLAGSDIRDAEMKRKNGIAQGRAGMPLAALASLVDFGIYLRDKLGDVRAPALLMHSENDHTIPVECMDAVANRLVNSPSGKVLRVREPFHILTLDVGKERVFDEVAQHVDRYL